MAELCFGLIAFAIALVIWAAVGHGLWVLTWVVWREVFHPQQPTTTQRKVPNEADDRLAVQRYLQALLHRGQLTPEEHQQLQATLRMSSQVQTPDSAIEALDAEIVFLTESATSISPFAPAAETRVASIATTPFKQPAPAAVHPLDRPDPPNPIAKPQPQAMQPSRTLAEMLQAFLEEKNIRWGEILAGLFIVGSAIGLIISLRNTLKAIPYFPALMFMLFTLLFHAAGLYSLRKWKLHAISRVVLVIALLLVPLSFGAGIVLSGSGETRRPLGDPIVLLAITIGLGAFSWVTWSSARELMRAHAWQLFVAVMGTAMGQIVINRWPVQELQGWQLIGLAILPLLCFAVPLATAILTNAPKRHLSERLAAELMLLTGVGLFSLLVPNALLLINAVDKREAWAVLSPVLSLAMMVVMGAGLLLHDRATSRRMAPWQTVGTSISIVSAMVLLGLLALAWPRPGLLIAVGLVDALFLMVLAVIVPAPILNVAAVATGTLAYLIAFHWLRGVLPEDQIGTRQLGGTLISLPSAAALTVWNLVVLGIGWQLRQQPNWTTRWMHPSATSPQKVDSHSGMLLASAAGVAGLTLLLTIHAAFAPWMSPDPWPMVASAIFVVYSIALLLCTRLVAHGSLPAIAAAVWWVALIHLFVVNSIVRTWLEPLSATIDLGHSGTALHALSVAALALAWRRYGETLAKASLVSIGLALVLVVLPWPPHYWERSLELLLIAATFGTLAIVARQPLGITAAQLALHAAAGMAIAGRWSGYEGDPNWFWQGGYLVEQVAAVAALSVVWSLGSLYAKRRCYEDYLPVEQVSLPLAAIGLLALTACGVAPGVGLELGWIDSENFVPNSLGTLVSHPLAWLTIVVLTAGFALRLWRHLDLDSIAGVTLALVIVPVLASQAWTSDLASGSALRWGLAIFLLVTCALIVYREQLLNLARRTAQWRDAALSISEVEQLRYFWLGLSAGPIAVITTLVVITSLQGSELGGPSAESLFHLLGLSASYGVPPLAVVAALLVFAVREREARFALSGAAVFQVAVNVALLLYLKEAEFEYLREIAALSLQVNAIGAAAYLLLWLAIDRWIEPEVERRERRLRWIDYSVFFLTRLSAVIALWAVAAIVVSPEETAPWDPRLANVWSFVAVALNVVVLACRYGGKLWRYGVQAAVLMLLCVCALAALSADCFAPSGSWRGFVVLETSWLVLALAITVISGVLHACQTGDSLNVTLLRIADVLAWRGIVIASIAGALAVYGGWQGPLHPWYSLGVIAAVQIGFVAQGVLLRSRVAAYLSLLLATATGLVIAGNPEWIQFHTPLRIIDILGFNLVLAGAVWLGVELWFQRYRSPTALWLDYLPAMHHVATALAVLLVGGLATLSLLGTLLLGFSDANLLVLRTESMTLVAAVGLLLAASLWDRRSRIVPVAYFWGLFATALIVVALQPRQPEWLLATLLVALAAYLAITSHIWKWGADLAGWGLRWGIPDPMAGLVQTSRWLPSVNLSLGTLVAVGSVFAVLMLPSREARMTVAVAPLLLAWCASSLAQQQRREPLLMAMYLLGAIAAVCFGWADIQEHATLDWLIRSIRLLMALSFATLLYGMLVPRWVFPSGDWHVAARRAATFTAIAALGSLVAILGEEIALHEPKFGVAALKIVYVIAVAVVLVGLAAGLFSLALLPGKDPLGMNEEGRMFYVYAGELVSALVFVHVFLVRPEMFEMLRPFWPYVLVTLAFTAVGLGELFRRSGIRVLAEPLDRTGGLLPLLPAIGMWWLASRSDYSLVLFAIGLIYLMHSWLRQSLTTGIAAALAGNGALWAWLAKDDGRSFFEHPQLWLIPPAVSVLLAAHLNRRRLEPATLTAVRYVATLVIYLSSTSEMFIVGLGNSLWPPVILALLGLAGALAGMLLQVRPFLYLGAGFVLLAMVSMVAHAAQAIDHVWPWWAFGIGVGLGILVLFGIFEKKRAEVTDLIQRLRQWT